MLLSKDKFISVLESKKMEELLVSVKHHEDPEIADVVCKKLGLRKAAERLGIIGFFKKAIDDAADKLKKWDANIENIVAKIENKKIVEIKKQSLPEKQPLVFFNAPLSPSEPKASYADIARLANAMGKKAQSEVPGKKNYLSSV